MGHWGAGINANDTFMEVYEAYFHYYNNDVPVDEIRRKLLSDFYETVKNEQTANDFWFALAKALWESKALDNDMLAKIRNIVESKADLKVWKELDASEKLLNERAKVLDKFLDTISTEKEKAKARKKIKLYSGFYEKGTCLAIKFSNGNYGGLLVLHKDIDTETGENWVVATDINSATLPTPADFQNAKILTGRYKDDWGNHREYFWIFVFEGKLARKNKGIENLLVNVGMITIDRVFKVHFEKPFQYHDQWAGVITKVEGALERIAGGEKENISGTVAEWIKPI